VPIVLSAVAILAVVGSVVTVVLLNRDGNSAPAAGADTPAATTTTRLPSSRPPSGSQPPSTSQVPGKAGWTTIPMPGGTYQVPADWQPSPVKRETGLGDSFDGGTEVGDYSCNEMSYFRGFTATGDVPSPNGAPLDLNQTIATYAKAFAGKYYQNATMNVDVPTPAPATVSGKKVATVTGKIRMTPASRCEASTGEVAILGVPLDNGGVRLLVVVNDLSGGPATPPALPDPLAEDILSTVTLS
jgi:hypothetical protein